MLLSFNGSLGQAYVDILLSYFLGYALLNIILGFFLWVSVFSQNFVDFAFTGGGSHPALTFTFAIIILSFAGLPPFFFFILKLGALAVTISTASWGLFAVLLVAISLGWVGYFKILLSLLSPSFASVSSARRVSGLSPLGNFFLSLLCFFLVTGYATAVDISLISAWVGGC